MGNCLYTSGCITFKDDEMCDSNNYFNRNRNVCGSRHCSEKTSVQCMHRKPIPAFTAEKKRRQAYHDNCVKIMIERQNVEKLKKNRAKEHLNDEKKRLKEYKKQWKLEKKRLVLEAAKSK